jgi:DNA-directed RNA polymerase specialized sigma54-like protein
MADQNPNLNMNQNVSPKVMQRTVLLGRVKMAQAIQMPESEWAKLLSDVEKDPLFQELITARSSGQSVLRYKRFGRTGLAGQFYEMQDANVAGGDGVMPEVLLEQKKHLVQLIQKIGQPKFERYFLYRENGESLETIANECNMSLDEAKQLNEFVISMSVQAEFYHPSTLASPDLPRPTLIGKIIKNDDQTFSISFFSPHLARGMYEVNHAALRRWQKDRKLDRDQASKLRKYIGLLELSNLKQGAFWRVIDLLLETQKEYLNTRDLTKLAPISLRHVARTLQFAPSTISRVMGMKSVMLPWDREVMLSHFMPGQRRVVLTILEKILSTSPAHVTDAALSKKIAEVHGVNVSRRTITACRHVLEQQKKAA